MTEKPFTFKRSKTIRKGYEILLYNKRFEKFRYSQIEAAETLVRYLNLGYWIAKDEMSEKAEKLLKHFGI